VSHLLFRLPHLVTRLPARHVRTHSQMMKAIAITAFSVNHLRQRYGKARVCLTDSSHQAVTVGRIRLPLRTTIDRRLSRANPTNAVMVKIDVKAKKKQQWFDWS
jgi:hypothetical protein